jgi:hypothetical protein
MRTNGKLTLDHEVGDNPAKKAIHTLRFVAMNDMTTHLLMRPTRCANSGQMDHTADVQEAGLHGAPDEECSNNQPVEGAALRKNRKRRKTNAQK